MNEVSCLIFNQGHRYHLTEGLNGCFVIFLVSSSATLSAHIPPRLEISADSQAGDKNLVAKMREFAALYHRHKQGHFAGHRVALIYARFEGKTAVPDQKDFIETCLLQFKVDFPMQEYDVKRPGEPRGEESGTAFVDGAAPTGPAVYLEDKVVLRVAANVNPPEPRQHISNPIFPPQTSAVSAGQLNPVSATTSMTRQPSTAPTTSPSVPSTRTVAGVQAGKQAGGGPAGQLTYVKSQPDSSGKGRLIETRSGQRMVESQEWVKGTKDGKTVLVCQKYKLYTDP